MYCLVKGQSVPAPIQKVILQTLLSSAYLWSFSLSASLCTIHELVYFLHDISIFKEKCTYVERLSAVFVKVVYSHLKDK